MQQMSKVRTVGAVVAIVGALGLVILGGLAWRAHAGLYGRDGRPLVSGRPGPGYYGPYGGRAFRGGAIPPVEGAKIIEVAASDAGCVPSEIVVKTGETVTLRFINKGEGLRVLTIPQQRVWVAAQGGQTVLTGLRTSHPGEYVFACRGPGQGRGGVPGRIVVTP